MARGNEEIYRIACDVTLPGEEVDFASDDCGELTFVSVTFKDGTLMVIGAEPDGGYTWSSYTAEDYEQQPMMERFLTTDGDVNLESLPRAIASNR